MEFIKSAIRTIPDFPVKGVQYKDITPLLSDGERWKKTIDLLKVRYENARIDRVVGVESRGFIFASALAYALNAGVCLVRKSGKLPHDIYQQGYDLEYGTDRVEIHQDALTPQHRILVVDDVLATGGTMAATLQLIQQNFEVEIVEVAFLIELLFLNGRDNLPDVPLHSLVQY